MSTTIAATTATTTLQDVIQTSDHDEKALPDLVPFSTLLQGPSFAAVDNSGSTGGAPLRVAQNFVNAIGVTRVSLWNSDCGPPVPRTSVVWCSTGGTSPHTIFEPTNMVPADANSFLFMTDGEIYGTAKLARHASVTAHLPSLLVLFGPYPTPHFLVQTYNVSVVMAHFTAARTAAVVVINDESMPVAHLIAAKGDWASALPSPPPLTDTLCLGECPTVTVSQLQLLPSRVYQTMALGSIPLSGSRILNLNALLRLPDGRGLVMELSEQELEDVARAFFTAGTLPDWRQQLNRWLVLVNQDASQQVEEHTRQATSGVHALLRRLGESTSPDETSSLRAQLQEAIFNESAQSQQASSQAAEPARRKRAVINAALAAVTRLEQTGMNATSLGSLSNRAARSNTVDRHSLATLASLATEEAPQCEDLVLRENGPVAICLRAMSHPDHNTDDAALNQPLRVGQFSENAVFEPTLVAMEIADRIEEMDASPLTRHRLSVCLPIVSIENETNRNAVYQRLCLVFMNGCEMQHVWLIALSSILKAIETQQWADPATTDTGRLLEWFAAQMMRHVVLPKGSRLSPNRRRPVDMALVSILQSDILLVHSSVVEASVILRLLHRFGAPAAFAQEDLRRSMQARIATAIPQTHRIWLQANASSPWDDQGPGSLTALLTAVYQTRVASNGAHVPISGTGTMVEKLDGLLSPFDAASVTSFANSMGIAMSDLVSPGITLAVLGTLDRVTRPHISSTAAVQAVKQFNAATAAAMHASGVDMIGRDDVMDIVRRRLAWARTPLHPLAPFATPFGPSVLWFYAPDGTITNLAEGFQTNPGEIEEDRSTYMFRLTAHLRANRGRLMARYFGTLDSGAFADRTITVPMHREMADAFHQTTLDLSLSENASSFVHQVVQRIIGRSGVTAGNIHSRNLERKILLLLPSLLQAASVHASNGLNHRDEPRPLPLIRRVELELGTRTLNDLGNPPDAIWVPYDDPEVLETLARVQKEQERAHINALRRRVTPATQVDANDIAAREQQHGVRPVDMQRFQRSVTWYLRHGATNTRSDGYVPIQSVLDALSDTYPSATVDQMLETAETDAKGRFSVVEENGKLLIRANQGHSIASVVSEQVMTPIENAEDIPVCLHGTYEDVFRNIVRSGGLNRMERRAIQMAVGLPDDPAVRSGIRASVDVVIYIDVERAMRVHELRFFRSQNNVICCEGPIPVDCFSRVVRLSDGTLLDF